MENSKKEASHGETEMKKEEENEEMKEVKQETILEILAKFKSENVSMSVKHNPFLIHFT